MIFFLFSCFSIQRFDAPISSSSLWKHTENYSQFDHAWEYSQQHDGKALLILENDTLIYSAYAHEYHPEIPLPFWSGTKTLACFLAYDAQNKGMMTLDEIVADTITEWKSDPTKNNITVLDLLQFTSGLKQDFFGLSLDGFRPPEQQTILDKYQHAIHLPMESSPGQSWSYGSVHLTVFASFFSQKTGMSIQ